MGVPGTEAPAEPRLTFGSWVGGDRDGHPLVTAETTRYALEALHAQALAVLRQHLHRLAGSLSLSDSMQTAPDGLYERISSARRRWAIGPSGYSASYPSEPWRQWVHLMLARVPEPGQPRPMDSSYHRAEELEKDLEFLADTLRQAARTPSRGQK